MFDTFVVFCLNLFSLCLFEFELTLVALTNQKLQLTTAITDNFHFFK